LRKYLIFSFFACSLFSCSSEPPLPECDGRTNLSFIAHAFSLSREPVLTFSSEFGSCQTVISTDEEKAVQEGSCKLPDIEAKTVRFKLTNMSLMIIANVFLEKVEFEYKVSGVDPEPMSFKKTFKKTNTYYVEKENKRCFLNQGVFMEDTRFKGEWNPRF
jgi:hypothetical protein